MLKILVSAIKKCSHDSESESGPSPRSLAWVELRLKIKEVNVLVAIAT